MACCRPRMRTARRCFGPDGRRAARPPHGAGLAPETWRARACPMRSLVLLALVLLPVGCSKPVTAIGVCGKLVEAKLATDCKTTPAAGLGLAATEHAEFNLPSVLGKTGQVMLFDRDAFYTSTVDAYGKAVAIAGPRQYGNPKARVFVQINSGASSEVGAKTKAVVDAL